MYIMENSELKKLIEKIIQDLGDDKPINSILLKAQIVAAKRHLSAQYHHRYGHLPSAAIRAAARATRALPSLPM